MNLIRRNKDATASSPTATVDDLRWLEVRQEHFRGVFEESPNGLYKIAWRDGTEDNFGARSGGHGKYLLVSGGQVLVSGVAERPNEGRVANNGTFVLLDWTFQPKHGALIVCDRAGRQLVKRDVKAHPYSCGIDPDGRYVVLQTAQSSSEDANLLWLIDLENSKVLWSKAPETGWAKAYEFDLAAQRVYLKYQGLGKAAYDLRTGAFANRDEWHESLLRLGDPVQLADAAKIVWEECAGNPNHENIPIITRLCRRAIEVRSDLQIAPRYRAVAYRLLGEVSEARGDDFDAISLYEHAMAFDAKVGVKRRLEALRKGAQKRSTGR